MLPDILYPLVAVPMETKGDDPEVFTSPGYPVPASRRAAYLFLRK